MTRRLFLAALAASLAACSSGTVVPPMPSYDLGAANLRVDASGWYTFGDTRFKGTVLNGAPDGEGWCIVKGGPAQATPCSFERGKRTDAGYVEARRAELARNTAETLAQERIDRQERDAAERQRIRDNNAAVEANDRMMRAGLAQFRQNLEAGAAQNRAIAVETARLANEGIQQKQAAADAEYERKQSQRAAQEAERKADARAVQARNQAQAEADAKDRLAQQKVEEETKRRDEAVRKEKQAQLAQAEQQRERERKLAEEKAERLRKEQADKAAEAAARADYLQRLAAGTRLVARTCPGGEGKYYVGGILPRIKPEVVGCVDVHYEGLCPGNAVGVSGVVANFQGYATDCFSGDIGEMNPTPSCKAKDVRVVVRAVRACGE